MSEFAGLLVLLLLSGIFSGSETALVALSMARVDALVKEGRSGASALYRLKSDPSRMLTTIGRELMYVPQQQTIAALFHQFRNSNRHFASVVDEFGTVRGVVTMEDLMEELLASCAGGAGNVLMQP